MYIRGLPNLTQKLRYTVNPLLRLTRRNRLVQHSPETTEFPLAPEIPIVPDAHRDDIYEQRFSMSVDYQPPSREYSFLQEPHQGFQSLDGLAPLHQTPSALTSPIPESSSLSPLAEINAAVEEAKLLSSAEAPFVDGQQFELHPSMADFSSGSAAQDLPLEAIAEQLLSNPLPADGIEGMLAEPPMGTEPPSAPEAPDLLPGM